MKEVSLHDVLIDICGKITKSKSLKYMFLRNIYLICL